MNGGQLPTNQLHDISWGTLDHASRAPQLMSFVCVPLHVCVYGYVCMRACDSPLVVSRNSEEPDCFTQQIWLIFSSISKLLR